MGKQLLGCLRLHVIDVYATVDLIYDVLSPAHVWIRRPYEIFRLVYDRFFFSCFEIFGINAIFVILQAVLIRRCALRLLHDPFFKLGRALHCFHRLVNSDILPNAIHIWKDTVSIGHKFHHFPRFQIKTPPAVLLTDTCLLAILRHRIGFFCHYEISLSKRKSIQAAPAFLVFIFRFPTCKDSKRAAGDRTRNKCRCSIIVIVDHSIEIAPILCQRGNISEISRTGGIIVLAARLIAGIIGRSRHRIVGLNCF